MKLKTARVQNYRSIRDTGEFDVEPEKTILVGPNEAGKSAVLQALQQIHAPDGIKGFDPLRDYPRALYNDITTEKVNPKDIKVTTVTFDLEESERKALPSSMKSISGYTCTRYIDNHATHSLVGAPAVSNGSGPINLLN
ncbi:AAA family ATPase [Acetobacter cerevisiae]|uniref:AAA family ATPase n=1 Tax=Acetobacter cerevisiae TaxID=178900 RepID=UPI00209EAD9A|nr:AAA family ATPase [Acetobacter cerevisiae]MCP1271777.1 AAA family ATPase [Acetobacter cerevisiae]MCP1279723.1 AAA family ATPase [Acetobacter cerevisiae]